MLWHAFGHQNDLPMIFGFSVAFAYVLTSLDGLLLFAALAAAGGRRYLTRSYVAAHVLVIGLAFLLGEGAGLIPAEMVGWLGLAPIALGVHALYRNARSSNVPNTEPDRNLSLIGSAASFFALNLDSLVLMIAFVADSSPSADLAVLLGATLAILGTLAAAQFAAKMLTRITGLARRLERLAPFVMIAAGVYILLDTSTDIF